MNTIYLDTETTGFVPGQICELSMIVEDSYRNIVNAKNYFFEVEKVDKGASDVTGITAERSKELSLGLKFCDKADEIYEIINKNMVVAHNINFDLKFVKTEFIRLSKRLDIAATADTMTHFRDVLKIPNSPKALKYGPYKNPNLTELANYFKVDSDKVREYCIHELFKNDETQLVKPIDFHDSRFDTAMMFICVNIFREMQSGVFGIWSDRFIRR